MFQAISNAFTFLITTVSDLFAFLLIARYLFVLINTEPQNPLIQFISKMTDFAVLRVKRFIPNRKNMELSTLSLALTIQFLKFLLIGFFALNFPNFFGLLILTLAEVIKITLNVFFYAILAQVILSWFPYSYTEVYNLLALITAPIMRPIRRIIPHARGFDISPIPALIGLQFFIILLIDPLYQWGFHIAYS
jgi:YggT family protein